MLLQNPTHDYCIIGSGAIGIALSLELAEHGKSVLLFEAGGDDVTDHSQSYYRCQTNGHPHESSSNGRFRVYGGSTERWGGQAMRFDPVDFSKRPSIHENGWPISVDEIEPFYQRAETFMGVSDPPYCEFEKTFLKHLSKDGHSEESLRESFNPFMLHYSVYTHQPRMREVHRAKLSNHALIEIKKNSAATKIQTDGNGNIISLTVNNQGQEEQIVARRYILATGGVENARFLLLQKEIFGIKELQDQTRIGQFFQDHPGAHVAELTGNGAAMAQELFRMKETPAMKLKARISWSSKERTLHEKMAVTGTFLMMRKPSEFDQLYAKNRFRKFQLAELLLALKTALKGKVYSPLHYTYLAVSAEDLRSTHSRITLSTEEHDPHGLPRAKVCWAIEKKVAESIISYVETLEKAFSKHRLGSLRKFDFLSDTQKTLSVLRDNSHHIGATAMGAAADGAVVGDDLKVHGFNNLWVAGTSVLPTGAHANPTLIALALSYRLADELEGGQLKNKESKEQPPYTISFPVKWLVPA